jgi:hypothetical protein
VSKKSRGNLVDIIKAELAAGSKLCAEIDNDCWTLRREGVPDDFDKWTDEAKEIWHDTQEVINSDDNFEIECDGGYGSGNCYGGDLLQAFAQIIGNIKVESV